MRIVVLGAGGVGSVIGGYLARRGIDVVMIARPGHTAAVQQNGLQLSGIENFRATVPTLADATQIHTADTVILTVKTKDMDRALAGIAHMQVGGLASLQNGLVKNEQIARVFGADRVIGATTMIGASLLRDGEVEYTLDGVTFFGELPMHRVWSSPVNSAAAKPRPEYEAHRQSGDARYVSGWPASMPAPKYHAGAQSGPVCRLAARYTAEYDSGLEQDEACVPAEILPETLCAEEQVGD